MTSPTQALYSSTAVEVYTYVMMSPTQASCSSTHFVMHLVEKLGNIAAVNILK